MQKGYKKLSLSQVPDISGDYPGHFKTIKKPLESRQVALTHRHMPAKTGGKGSRGHLHKTQEEVIFVISGKVQVKVNDDIIDLGPNDILRIDPGNAQSTWNDGPEDVELLIISTHSENVMDDVDFIPDFWPIEE